MCRTVPCLIGLVMALAIAGAVRASLPDDPALVIYYSFDDFADVVPDESGKGHDATVQGDVAPIGEEGHRAARFLGTGGPAGLGYLDLDGANFPIEDIPTSAFTVAAWVKCDNTGDHHAIFNARAADATWVVHPELRSDGRFRWLLRAAGGTTLFDIQAGSVTWGEWLHYVGTYDKASRKAVLYVNKQVVSEQTVANAADVAGDWGKGARVGINVDNARPFTGLMDEFHLFKRALTPADLDALAQIPPQLKAYGPTPPDRAKHVAVPLLQWTAGDTAVFHDVYLGTDPALDEADLIAPHIIPAIWWHTAGFEPGTTYYWRVDEVEADGVTIHEGDVWQFTTATVKASDPNPANGAKWVDVEIEVAWTPGTGAMSHDVYFGIDKAAVEAADAGVFKGNQAASAYDPGLLAADTVYYWRIDEHAADDVVHPGEVWSFRTAGPGLGVRAEYFRGAEPAGVPVLTQVEKSIDHNWGSGEVAAGLSDDVSARWTADLEAPTTETYQFITTSDDGVRLWLDGRLIINNWASHGSTDDLVTVDLIAGQVYFLQVDWYENSGNAIAKLSWKSPTIQRQAIPAGPLQLPVRATSPYPANAAPHAPQAPVLHWRGAEQAAHHDVYFGQTADAVANADSTSADVYQGRQAADETTFDPGALEWNKTYYWRVDEVNATGPDSPWRGSLWSFTTADFLVVDDFESYTDDEGNRIYQTWIDGMTNGLSGSVVGYLEAPFVEHRVVYGGYQSMPLAYKNADSPWYSEIERTWETPQDWTVQGLDTLTLHIRGQAGNDPAPFYVAVEDKDGRAGVVTHPDPAIVAATGWTEWSVPLSQFSSAGVNLTAVTKFYIGVGSRSATAAGGAGSLFIDNVYVIKP